MQENFKAAICYRGMSKLSGQKHVGTQIYERYRSLHQLCNIKVNFGPRNAHYPFSDATSGNEESPIGRKAISTFSRGATEQKRRREGGREREKMMKKKESAIE